MPCAVLLTLLALPLPQDAPQDPPAGFSFVDPAQTRESLRLRLEDAIRRASQHAPGIRQQALAAESATFGVVAAKGAFDPVLFTDLTYDYGETPSTVFAQSAGGFDILFAARRQRQWRASEGLRQALLTGGSLELSIDETFTETSPASAFDIANPVSNASLGLTYTQPLLRGGWLLNGGHALRTAELDAASQAAGFLNTERDVVQQVIDSYWDLAFARSDAEVKALSLSLAEELKRQTEARYRVGAAAQVEVVQTEADIAARREALLTAWNTIEQAEDALRVQLFPFATDGDWRLALEPVTEPPAPEPLELTWEAALLTALEHRQDLEQLRLAVKNRELDWEVANRNTLPKLDFTSSVRSSAVGGRNQSGLSIPYEGLPDLYDPMFGLLWHGYTFSLTFELPLGNRSQRGVERQTRRGLELAQRELADKEHDLAREVRDAVRQVQYLIQRIDATEQAVLVARRQLQAEERRLQEGASTNFQVLQFQEDLAQALTNGKSAQIGYAKARARLNTVRGLSWTGQPRALAVSE